MKFTQPLKKFSKQMPDSVAGKQQFPLRNGGPSADNWIPVNGAGFWLDCGIVIQ
jgi:hypothetical protein